MKKNITNFKILRFQLLKEFLKMLLKLLKKNNHTVLGEKYDFAQDIYYIKELGVGYIRRGEYETAISYYMNLLERDILYYQYHAYKQLGRICKEMNNPDEFKRLYENHN